MTGTPPAIGKQKRSVFLATSPRISPPGAIIMISQRVSQRMFLLKPDRQLIQNIVYILAYLQTRYDIEYHALIVLSTNLHLLLRDRRGDQLQAFNRDFFSLLARSTNCYWGRNENLFNTSKPNCVLVAPRSEDVVARFSYIDNNPVEAGLVSHSKKWPGLRIMPVNEKPQTLSVERPDFFYDPKGSMPEKLTVTFSLPQVWDAEPEELLKEIQIEWNRLGDETRARFRAEGKKFMGAKRVKRQSPHSTATSREVWFKTEPNVACKDTSLRIRFLRWRRKRNHKYQEKREALRDGQKDVLFPEGTYVLHFVYGQAREKG